MSLILAVIEARASSHGGGSHIHLSPADFNALWHLTQWLGRQFWHMTPWAQVTLISVPSIPGFVWMWHWDPLAPQQRKKKSRWLI